MHINMSTTGMQGFQKNPLKTVELHKLNTVKRDERTDRRTDRQTEPNLNAP